MRLLVICPSRSRPANAARLVDAWQATTAGVSDLLIATDDDDPANYLVPPPAIHRVAQRRRMAGTLNLWATHFADQYDALGFCGDDHVFRTTGWDQRVIEQLDRLGTGLVYGNDLLQGMNLPTAVFVTADIVRTLGWMAPPGLVHLFLDNSWLALGHALDAITYLSDVVIEHMHPLAGKAEPDAGYSEANASDVWTHDEAVYRRWLDEDLAQDVARIRAATAAHV